MKQRLDSFMADNQLTSTRSQAESYIKLGKVEVNGRPAAKAGQLVDSHDKVRLLSTHQYVSRAGLKLESVARQLRIDFKGKLMLDVGSSTGGFTEFALRAGASKVLAVDVGRDQLHPSLRNNPKIELHEQTDIRDFWPPKKPTIVTIDVSFISLREILPHVAKISAPAAEIIAMVKPQFEATKSSLKHKGVIKNAKIRRLILKDFEAFLGDRFAIIAKADSQVAGSKGNVERFYKLKVNPETA